ncbi:MAG: deoxyhypusine synthase family protein [Candidatus Pacearchaeota archaeon]|nr:deoxyhypusine synthase family protein [Candidatus Pacearchaeota archaeon]
MKKVEPVRIWEDMKVSELVDSMGDAGFGAGKINRAAQIMGKMFSDEKCKVFVGLAGAMVPAGMKQIILDLLDDTDVLVTTGATLTHDLIEALGDEHYLLEDSDGDFDDGSLNRKGFDRMYNVVMRNRVYENLERFFVVNWEKFKECKTIKDIVWKIGELCPGTSEDCILKKCYEKKIPLFCPALADSGIGLMIWGRKASGKEIFIDAFEDMKEIIDISWTARKTGVIYVGGGVPKNFIQQSLQFSKGADYGIQITADSPEPGGSSGAPLKEGISWGKLKKNADFADVRCDATIALPLILGAVRGKSKKP